jgi:hypothetical protein
VAVAERQQRQVSRTLDGRGHAPLVLGARARLAPALDLEPFRDESLEPVYILVVYVLDVVNAEDT